MYPVPEEQERRRALKACDPCRARRSKCVRPCSANLHCQACQDLGTRCTSQTISRKRGPPKGINLGPRRPAAQDTDQRSPSSSNRQSSWSIDGLDPSLDVTDVIQLGDSESSSPPRARTVTPVQPTSHDIPQSSDHLSGSLPAELFSSSNTSISANGPLNRASDAMLEESRVLERMGDRVVEDYLGIYWDQVHVVWPAVYKPAFNRQSTPHDFLLLMIIVASLTTPPGSQSEVIRRTSLPSLDSMRFSDLDYLQRSLLHALIHQARGEQRLAYEKALDAALSILQSSCHPLQAMTEVETQSISRTAWCIYRLHHVLSEAENRRPILSAASVPWLLPSTLETDELEFLPISGTQTASRRRAFAMTTLQHFCCLTLIGEQVAALVIPNSRSRELGIEDDGKECEVDTVLRSLEKWLQRLPEDVKTVTDDHPIHYTALILRYHALSLKLLSSNLDSPVTNKHGGPALKTAVQIIDLVGSVHRRGISRQLGTHTNHPLALALLCLAFDVQTATPQTESRASLIKGYSSLRELASFGLVTAAHLHFFSNLICHTT